MELYSVASGTIKRIEDVNDPAFAEKMLGEGIAVLSEDGRVSAPADGIVTSLFPTGHAVGITTEEGIQVLIHIGIDTVNMKGRGFIAHVRQGDRVQCGQLLVSFDPELIKVSGYDPDVIVVILNSGDYRSITATNQKKLQTGDVLLTLERQAHDH